MIGTVMLLFGTIALTKAFIAHGQAEAERVRRAARPSARPEEALMAARPVNVRGQYGRNSP